MNLLYRPHRVVTSKVAGAYARVYLSIVIGLILATAANVGGPVVSEYLTAGFEEPLESDSDEESSDEEIAELFVESNGRSRRLDRGATVSFEAAVRAGSSMRSAHPFLLLGRRAELRDRNGMGGPLRC
jgi:hypothetical protein